MFTPTPSQDVRFVTILMPVRNEAGIIARSLGAVLAQDYPAECTEIIVADGMSIDGTRQAIQGFQRQHANLRLIDNPGKIVPTGLNAALRQARGEVIIRVDGHCEIAPDYVSHCVAHLMQDRADGVGGFTQTIGETYIAQAIAMAMSSPFGVGDSAFRTQQGQTRLVDSVPFPAYTRTMIDKAGLYDEELVRNQDDEYNYRLRKLGAKILLAADVHSRYYSRTSLGSLWKQYYQYGYWKVRVLQKHPRQMRPRQFVPLAFVGSLSASGLLCLAWPPGRWLFLSVLAAYLAANLAASFYTALRKGWKHLPLLPLIYAILHLSYGLGFLVGLLRFANRWGDRQGKVPCMAPATTDGEHV
jgi:glycosyltransferase involved in cell wall biosynthesis